MTPAKKFIIISGVGVRLGEMRKWLSVVGYVKGAMMTIIGSFLVVVGKVRVIE